MFIRITDGDINLINEDLIKYNANAYGRSTGDCVIRALSLAYNIDYKKVASELHKLRRDMNEYAWNISRVYGKFLDAHGFDKFTKLDANTYVSVQKFVENNPDGVYVLTVGKKLSDERTDHLVCVANGDVYDSWDSTGRVVKNYWTISGARESFNREVVSKEDMAELARYAVRLSYEEVKTYDIPYEGYFVQNARQNVGDNHIVISQNYMIADNNINDGAKRPYDFKIQYRFSPRMSLEERYDIVVKNTKATIRVYVRNMIKDIKNILDAAAFSGEYQNLFKGNWHEQEVLKKLPYWCRRLMTSIDIDGYNGMDSKYYASMQNLNGDPRATEHDQVEFYAADLKELIWQIEKYKKDYSRINYDY